MEYQLYETSSAQKRLFLIDGMLGVNIIYNMPSCRRIEGPLDRVRLEEALQALVQRHEGLRTSFVLKDGEVLQRVDSTLTAALSIPDHGTQTIDGHMAAFIRPFTLEQAPLWRAELVRLGEDSHLFLFDIHHIIADAVTIEIIFAELMAFYQGQELAPLEFQYVDYAIWHNDQLKEVNIRKQEEFWLSQFADGVPVLDLPFSRNGQWANYEGRSASLEIPPELAGSFRSLCLRYNVTPYILMLAVYGVLLAKYTGQEDLVIGTPVAGRTHAEFEGIVGMFVNTLALRHKPAGHKRFSDYLDEVADHTFMALENQDYPFEMLVEKLNPERISGRNPLFDACFSLENRQSAAERPVQGLGFEPHVFEHRIAKFDLSLFTYMTDDAIILEFEYRRICFTEDAVQRMLRHFSRILESVCADPDLPISRLEMLTEEEGQQLLLDFNASRREYPQEHTIHRLFEQQAERSPDSIAVQYGEARLTYRELNEQANRLARVLVDKGVGTNEIVCVLAHTSPETIVGILAILKAGAAYLSIDPDYPSKRITYLLEDSKARICLCPQGRAYDIPSSGVLFLPVMVNRSLCADNLPSPGRPDDLMYVIYTSGSTGTPKGVMLEHRNLARIVMDAGELVVYPEDRVLQTCSLAFDVSVYEIWGTLVKGATLCLLRKEELLDTEALRRRMNQYGITVSWFTAPLLNQLVDMDVTVFTGLRCIITGGESLSPRHTRLLLDSQPELMLLNGYGPSESTIYTSFYNVTEVDGDNISIGKPVPNTRVYILDKQDMLQPVGLPGELCIGGDGLARGYLGQPELTAEKFGPDPFNPGGRMYRTGDKARWLPGGMLEYLGRFDHQVKIRGYRVELGEIDVQITKLEGVREAVVTVQTDASGTKCLCAYVVGSLPVEQLRRQLAKTLPEYMVPSYLIPMESLPLNTNGKVDRKALPAPETVLSRDSADVIAALTPVEQQLQAMWSELFGAAQVGLDDNFFALGGHSLLAASLVWEINTRLEVQFSLGDIFSYPTIRELAARISDLEGHRLTQEISGAPDNGYGALPEQPASPARCILLKPGDDEGRQLFFIHDGSGGVGAYRELADRLERWNCRGISLDLSEEQAAGPRSIEEAAGLYLAQVQAVQPRGPYYLAGWSLGGTIAFEMVRQLEERQEEAALLTLVDTLPPGDHGHDSFEEDILRLESLAPDAQEWNTAFPDAALPLISGFERLTPRQRLGKLQAIQHWITLQQAYRPKGPISSPVILLVPEPFRKGMGKRWKQHCRGGLEVHGTEGDHYSMMHPEHAGAIGSILLDSLNARLTVKHGESI
ncbi:non-ribosomal peptide synthetase [Paenibacillus tepidiphilus]|uniref:non-ribosomal peptide synthetase n=1 Tax=Paenibacillus tepidiphilus TaxID=2608683 RepID=UPI0013A5ABE8|nr:non-ribosomal peptide synthetase [Paenibacillus tepidiphilus]